MSAEHDLQQMREKGSALLAQETHARDTFEDGFANGYWQAFTEALAELARLRLLVQREQPEPHEAVKESFARSAETAETRADADLLRRYIGTYVHLGEKTGRFPAAECYAAVNSLVARVAALTEALQEIERMPNKHAERAPEIARAALAAVSGGTDNSPEQDLEARPAEDAGARGGGHCECDDLGRGPDEECIYTNPCEIVVRPPRSRGERV